MIAGCLFNDSISALTKGSSDRMHAVKLDVTDRADLDNVYNWMASNMKGGNAIATHTRLASIEMFVR